MAALPRARVLFRSLRDELLFIIFFLYYCINIRSCVLYHLIEPIKLTTILSIVREILLNFFFLSLFLSLYRSFLQFFFQSVKNL
jgi:hypothetical protein